MKIAIDSFDRQEALRYMGQRGEVSTVLEQIVEKCEKRLLEVIEPCFVYRVFGIKPDDEGVKLTGSPLILRGSDIKAHLEGCDRAVLMCATLGEAADRLIRGLEVTDVTEAFVTDALASAAVEEVCRKADGIIAEKLAGYHLTWRFSPGYGDFPIETQKEFLETLNAQKITGVCTGENNILIPRKSVTAAAGVSSSPLPRKKRGCGNCVMSGTCVYRKRGEHCGV